MKMTKVQTGGKLYIAGEYAVLTPGQTAIIKNIPIHMTAVVKENSTIKLSSDMFDYSATMSEDKNYALWIEDFSKIPNKKILKHLNNQLFIIKTLNHPNVLKFFENIKENRKVYVITEYYNGGTLRDFLDKYLQEHNKPPSEEIVQYIMRQIIEGVKYLHNKKIFHRDLKLEYIMLNYEDEKDKENNNIMKSKIIISDFFSAGYFKKGKFYNEIIAHLDIWNQVF